MIQTICPKVTAEPTIPQAPNAEELAVIARIIVPGIVREIAATARLGLQNLTIADVTAVLEYEWSVEAGRHYRETIVILADRVIVGQFCTKRNRVVWGKGAARYGYRRTCSNGYWYDEKFTNANTIGYFEGMVADYMTNGVKIYG